MNVTLCQQFSSALWNSRLVVFALSFLSRKRLRVLMCTPRKRNSDCSLQIHLSARVSANGVHNIWNSFIQHLSFSQRAMKS